MNESLLALARSEICAMTPYSSARSEKQYGQIYLNANENNYFLAGYKKLNRYPEPQPLNIIHKLSKIYGVSAERIIVTRGSDEAVDLLMRVFGRAYQDQILICPPTYGMYAVSANIQGLGIVEVPLIAKTGFKLDVAGILKQSRNSKGEGHDSDRPEHFEFMQGGKERATGVYKSIHDCCERRSQQSRNSKGEGYIKLIFLCSPNNPTGNLLAQKDILKICRELQDQAIIVVDEAYIEFADAPSLATVLADHPNLVVLRTLSKLYGLAGVRCGVALADPTIIYLLKKIIAPYPIPVPVTDIVDKYLNPTNLAKIKTNRQKILKERAKMFDFLKNLSLIKKVWPSETNFILAKVDNAQKIIQYCAKHGVIIRDRSRDYGLMNCIRFSIGTTHENNIVREVLKNA